MIEPNIDSMPYNPISGRVSKLNTKMI